VEFRLTAVTIHFDDLERLPGAAFIFPGLKELLDLGAIVVVQLFFDVKSPVGHASQVSYVTRT
jgi:hypothetical protein